MTQDSFAVCSCSDKICQADEISLFAQWFISGLNPQAFRGSVIHTRCLPSGNPGRVQGTQSGLAEFELLGWEHYFGVPVAQKKGRTCIVFRVREVDPRPPASTGNLGEPWSELRQFIVIGL